MQRFYLRSIASVLLALVAMWFVGGLILWGWNSWLVPAVPHVPTLPWVAAMGLAALLVLLLY